MEKLLTLKEREKLIRRHRKETNKRICDRIKAVLAYDDGYSYSEIARILLLDDETIRRHIDDYQQEQKLKPSSGGSDSHLTDKETQELIEHLRNVTYLYVKDICQYVLKIYRKEYSISGMTKWLHANDFSYKKAHGVPAKADREKQKKFIQYYNRLKKKYGKKEPIYFADSVHPQHQTQLTYGWIPKGERKEIATTGRQKRLNFIGGICLNRHRFTYTQADKVMYTVFVIFFGNCVKIILENIMYMLSGIMLGHIKMMKCMHLQKSLVSSYIIYRLIHQISIRLNACGS